MKGNMIGHNEIDLLNECELRDELHKLRRQVTPAKRKRVAPPSVRSSAWVAALTEKYQRQWRDTMPTRGKEKEQQFLQGQHYAIGEFLQDLAEAKESAATGALSNGGEAHNKHE